LPAATDCRDLREAARVLCHAFATASEVDDAPSMTPEEEAMVLRLME
jgi:hypothetical protein